MRDHGQVEGRHLAAIMFMDMVGYSARMQEDESGAIDAVRTLWGIVRPLLAEQGGREVDLAGDGMLMEFPGALAAIRCAQAVHARLHAENQGKPESKRVRVRAGVHLGDLEHREGRIYGDGVNVAARVITLSPPGATAMTSHVRDQLLNVLDTPPQSLGLKQLKNIKVPLELWCLPGAETTPAELAAARAAAQINPGRRKWTFGDAVFDERALELSVGGQAVALDKPTLDVLAHLLRHAGEVVTREELSEAAWHGKVPDGQALDASIARLHVALQDSGRGKLRVVEGFGYRLAVPVTVEALPEPAAARFGFRPGDKPPLRPLWSLVERLGAGGHGEAWLARHDKTHESRVFKFALEASALASLKREITISRVLSESLGQRTDFARILDWNLEEAPYFIESQYSNEGNLAQWVEKAGFAALPLPVRLDLIAQVAEALSAAHAVGVLHKDLKPGNVLVDAGESAQGARPRIKLCDFGSGGVLDQGRLEALGITRMGFTKTLLDTAGTTSGTPLYIAPEVIAGQPFTVQSDIYALGVMLYQFVVGNLRSALAPGWELAVEEELLCEDIALAAAGEPSHRFADASLLAQRLRTLEERRRQREGERKAREEAEDNRRRLERVRARRVWLAGVVATLILGLGVSLHQYFKAARARDESDAVSRFLVEDVLALGSPHRGATVDLTLEKILDRAERVASERLSAQPGAEMRVRLAIGGSYRWLGKHDSNCRQLELAAALGERHFGRATPETMDILLPLAECILLTNPAGGLRLNQEVLRFWEEEGGSLSPAALSARGGLANKYRLVGESAEAIVVASEVRYDEVRDAARDSTHFLWLSATLGMSLQSAGRHTEAEAVFADVVRRSIRLQGADHYFVTWGRQWRAGALSDLGRYSEAEKELLAAAKRRSELMGRYATNVLSVHQDLADVWADQGRFDEARVLLRDLLEHCTVGCNDRHSLLLSLADVLQRSGRAREALALKREAWQLPLSRWASINPLFRASMALSLANSYVELGQPAEARAALDEIPAEAGRLLDGRSPQLASKLRIEGLLARMEGQRDRAREALKGSLEIEELNRGRAHWRTQRVGQELAALDQPG